jgi:hypothetical protein
MERLAAVVATRLGAAGALVPWPAADLGAVFDSVCPPSSNNQGAGGTFLLK